MSDLLSDVGSLAKGAIDFLTNSPLKLGNISFKWYEIPERIPFGGRQTVSSKRLIGGRKIIETTGYEDVNPTWSGRFQGAGAIQRARAVDAMCQDGLPVTLNYGGMNFTVIIVEFAPLYERNYQIPYTITCEVVTEDADDTNFLSDILGSSLDDLVGADTLDALGVGDLIGSTTLNSALSNVSSTLSTVGSLTGISALNKLGGAVSGAQGVANLLSNTGNTSLSNVAFGVTGELKAVGVSVGNLGGAATAAMTLANSNAVGNILTRITKNIGG